MPDTDKLKIIIDREECIGDAACEAEAPETFYMDDDAKACVREKVGDDVESVLAAAECCPVDCIKIVDGACDKTLYPED
jgi:ferredoxin